MKFRPRDLEFLDLVNPRSVLEIALRSYSCMTQGDQIYFPYLDKSFYMDVLEVKPANAACIIETDVNVDFEAPPGYKEPTAVKPASVKEDAVVPAAPTASGAGMIYDDHLLS